MPIFLRNGVYWIDIRHNGQRFRQTSGTSDKEAALRLHDELKASLWKKKNLGEQLPYTFAQAVDKWLGENSHKRSISTDACRLTWLVERIGATKLRDIDEDVVERLITAKKKETWRGQPVSNATVNRTLSALSVILKAARVWKWLDKVPLVRTLDEGKQTPRVYTREQVVSLVSHLPLLHACIFSFALMTGQRMSNVLQLRWEDVDLENCCFWIRGEDFKNAESHNVPLNAEALATLKLVEGRSDAWVFAGRGAKPLKRMSGEAWYRALEAAKIPFGRRKGFTFHHTRHTWASYHMMNNTPKEVLLALGGWKTANMVERYAHLAPGFAAQYAGNVRISR
jgi:integrase